jgi:hypothetical protein
MMGSLTGRPFRPTPDNCPPDGEFETAAGNHITYGDVLGQAYWVMKPQQQHAGWNANSFGVGCDCGRHWEHRGRVAIVNEVMLGQPYVIEAMVLGRGYFGRGFRRLGDRMFAAIVPGYESRSKGRSSLYDCRRYGLTWARSNGLIHTKLFELGH